MQAEAVMSGQHAHRPVIRRTLLACKFRKVCSGTDMCSVSSSHSGWHQLVLPYTYTQFDFSGLVRCLADECKMQR